MKASHYWSWLVAYIDAESVSKVHDELSNYPEYREVEAYIPTVKVLKKTLKGKDSFEYVPMLFNYGFFKVPRKYAVHPNYLENMKKNITCIYGWVKDLARMKKTTNGLKLGERKFINEQEISVATVSSKDITELIKSAVDYSVHSREDIDRLKPGQFIMLHGYPWDNVPGTVVEINPKKQEVKVKVMILNQLRDVNVDVSYDNVFFTIYHGRRYDDSIGIKNNLNTDLDTSLNNSTFKKYSDGKDK